MKISENEPAHENCDLTNRDQKDTVLPYSKVPNVAEVFSVVVMEMIFSRRFKRSLEHCRKINVENLHRLVRKLNQEKHSLTTYSIKQNV